MRSIILLLTILVLCTFSLTALPARTITFSSLLNDLVDLQDAYAAPDYQTGMWSSFDRKGGNRDDSGFIRKEGNDYVLAEMKGPGAITRIAAINPTGALRVYLDNQSDPIIDLPFRSLFLKSVKPFVDPFVYAAADAKGEHWSSIPIPYAKSCKISASVLGFYQIEFVTYPAGTQVESFQLPPTKEITKAVNDTAKQFRLYEEPLKSTKTIIKKTVTATLAAGETILFATFTGPAILRGMQIKGLGNNDNTAREMVLRIYWDDESSPSVVSPIYDFFGGKMKTLALGMTSTNFWYCYLPMPFRSHARIELENGNLQQSQKIAMTFFEEEKKDLPTPLRTFHAWWNRQNPTPVEVAELDQNPADFPSDPEHNYVALSTHGTGHLIGAALYRTRGSDSDAMVFIDHNSPPLSYMDTGNELFFNQSAPVHTVNFPLFAGAVGQNRLDTLLRIFLPAKIPFREEVQFTFEHGSGNVKICDYAGVIYWYQQEPHEAFSAILPANARWFRSDPLPQPIIEYRDKRGQLLLPWEAEELTVSTNGGTYDVQDMIPQGPDWSGNRQFRFEALSIPASVSFQLPRMEYSGWYDFEYTLSQSPDNGIAEVALNDLKLFSALDLYSGLTKRIHKRTVSPLFMHAAETPNLNFSVVGKNKQSQGYNLGIDTFEWIPLPSTPKSLLFRGPYNLSMNKEYPNPRVTRTSDGNLIMIGYGPAVESEKENHTWTLKNPSDLYAVGSLLKNYTIEDGLFYVNCRLSAKRAGIYRFEVEPAELIPFLLEEESGKMMLRRNRILINDTPLLGEETLRLDVESGRILPPRFHVPLKAGENTLSWIVRCDRRTVFRPRIFGLEPIREP